MSVRPYPYVVATWEQPLGPEKTPTKFRIVRTDKTSIYWEKLHKVDRMGEEAWVAWSLGLPAEAITTVPDYWSVPSSHAICQLDDIIQRRFEEREVETI